MARNTDPMAAYTIHHTPEQVLDVVDGLDGEHSAKADAIAHFGGLMSGKYTRETVEYAQRENLSPGPDFDPVYAYHYVQTWDALYTKITF